MKTKNLGFLVFGLLAGTIAFVGPLWTPVADAAPHPKAIYIPPTNMVVECANATTGSAIVTANVPSRTKFVQYHFYKTDISTNLQTYDPTAPFAYFAFEEGPGWPKPYFPYATQVGGSQINAPNLASFVWAEAMTRYGSKPLAWGFATCFSRDPINIVLYSGSTTIVRYALTGYLEIQP